MNVALAELPDFTALPGRRRADIIPPASSWRRASPTWSSAYLDAKAHGWSSAPIIEMLIPSTLDDSARAARHARRQPVLPACGARAARRASWDDHRETVADLMIDTVDASRPNFKASVLGAAIMSPLDLERTFGLVGGDIFHGALGLDQLFSARPMLGHADYRAPLPASTCADPAPIPAVASRARPGTMRPANPEGFQTPAPRARDVTYEVRIVDLEDIRVAALEYRGNRRFIDGAVRKFVEWRRRNNLPPKRSATFNIVYRDSDDDCRYDLCAATQRDLVDDGSGVLAKTIPGGRCAVIRHSGTDDGLGGRRRLSAPCVVDTKSGERLRAFPMFFQRVRFPPEVPADEAITDVFLPLE